jgi:Asp-tRNA(Asn)/Glu-tRNA(Gln) amidotransferase A subunit family amidase
MQDRVMEDTIRIRRREQDDFAEEDRQAHVIQRLPDQDADMGLGRPEVDVPMGVNAIELPQGLQLSTGVNLDYEELASSVALEESEELWLPQELPPEFARE